MLRFWFFVGFVSAVGAFPTYNLEENASCSNDDASGTCKRVSQCQPAVDSLVESRTHPFKRCSFLGREEVVCCPNSATRDNFGEEETEKPGTDASSRDAYQRKSIRACLAFSNELNPSVSFQILGGEEAEEGEFPHMAVLGYKDPNEPDNYLWNCGGSLISNQYVLTAAHCVVSQSNSRPAKVRLGITDLTKKSGDFDVESIQVHQNYSRRTKHNDIALIKLNKKVRNTDKIHPACLYDKNDEPQPLIVTGWGQTTNQGDTSSLLLKATLNIYPTNDCDSLYKRVLNKSVGKNQLCAISSTGTKDTCRGDSGGPLQFQQRTSSNVYTIVGVTSYGLGCGGQNPGVYTKVANYLDWIEERVWS